jgi:hypothetical protein
MAQHLISRSLRQGHNCRHFAFIYPGSQGRPCQGRSASRGLARWVVEARRNTLLKELEETREEERAEREEEECAVGELLSTHFVTPHVLPGRQCPLQRVSLMASSRGESNDSAGGKLHLPEFFVPACFSMPQELRPRTTLCLQLVIWCGPAHCVWCHIRIPACGLAMHG